MAIHRFCCHKAKSDIIQLFGDTPCRPPQSLTENYFIPLPIGVDETGPGRPLRARTEDSRGSSIRRSAYRSNSCGLKSSSSSELSGRSRLSVLRAMSQAPILHLGGRHLEWERTRSKFSASVPKSAVPTRSRNEWLAGVVARLRYVPPRRTPAYAPP
jgi:hypothetical protein